MGSNSSKLVRNSGLRERRYAIRYPFAADAEILDLKSGIRLTGVTSDLSQGGCFVCTRRSLEIGTRVRLTLKFKNQSVTMLAMVRVEKPKVGMGLEALEVDANSNKTLLRWIEGLSQSSLKLT